MKNILYHYSSQQIHTGSPRVLMGLIEGLDRDRFTPLFLAKEEGALTRELINRGCRVLNGESGNISSQKLRRNLLNLSRLSSLLRKNNIALVHMNELGWNSELAVAAKLVGVPVFFHIHNPEKMIRRNINCRIGSKYIFVSGALAESCCEDDCLREKVEILHNPIDVGRLAVGRSNRPGLALPADVPVVGTVAQICKRKGIDVLIDTAERVLKEMPHCRFVIVGPDGIGEERFASEVRQRVDVSGLHNNILFLGPRDDIPDFLASLDVFFLPTRSEPFGLVLAEAMAARVPVVATRVGGIPEIIPSHEFGITADLDAASFASAIIRLLSDGNLSSSIAEAGFNRVKEQFDVPVFQKKLKRLYYQALHLTEGSSHPSPSLEGEGETEL